jgi:hypothetical protein
MICQELDVLLRSMLVAAARYGVARDSLVWALRLVWDREIRSGPGPCCCRVWEVSWFWMRIYTGSIGCCTRGCSFRFTRTITDSTTRHLLRLASEPLESVDLWPSLLLYWPAAITGDHSMLQSILFFSLCLIFYLQQG